MKKRTKKIILIGFLIIINVLLLSYYFPLFKDLSTEEGRLIFKDEIQSLGFTGFIVIVLLQISQVILAIIPGEPLEILAGMCYGGFFGTLFILCTTTILSIIIFFLVRRYGKKLIYFFFNKEKVDKLLKSKMFRNNKKLELTMLILFIVPGTPKDMLIYIAGFLPIDAFNFLIISSIARLPSIISSTVVGANIVNGNFIISIFVYIITFIIVAIILYIISRFDKDRVNKIFESIE